MRSMVEGRRARAVSGFLEKRSLRSRPSTALRAVPLPSKLRGGFWNQCCAPAAIAAGWGARGWLPPKASPKKLPRYQSGACGASAISRAIR
jgi:hypothetical protein